MVSENRVSMVTGGAGGFGRAIASSFATRGDHVVVVDLDEAGAAEVAAGLPGPGRHVGLGCDVRAEESVVAVFDAAEERLGGVDTLVNSGGVREIVDVLTISVAQWHDVVATNLTGTFLTCREFALRAVRRADGASRSIVNIASVAGLTGIGNRPAYSASKHGVVGLSKNLATDLARHGIRVNVVAPGTIRTPMTEGYYADEEFVASLATVVPLGAGGSATDVAETTAFLTGPASGFVTGVVLPVDGGWSASKSYSVNPDSAYFAAANSSAGVAGDAAHGPA
ncbi:2-deoxy-D-gluconate 3-dehydrogenase [Pseudonocardia sulfidoxydans NBRC 16205]|uniref:2-deoxy-D-gluconate 3-dehydrogenase n=1 Tax=Pseudonocardia sulfidoxydans NBRC 16205 TaxID=1223511 RepID=A0A511DAY1_9PSEU|nr:SDR family NAD(P)-dependent oxidoreductase [Pseudonocardia sulfidoxydans]GEL21966.1 2-deoxy-D-gluconate 3-dehydrogenase [Pseudonocardia sulfidoxydans NBRC 16205]